MQSPAGRGSPDPAAELDRRTVFDDGFGHREDIARLRTRGLNCEGGIRRGGLTDGIMRPRS